MAPSTVDPTLAAPIQPTFPLPSSSAQAPGSENAGTATVISALAMIAHPEGGYFVETDRSPVRVANPFHASYDSDMAVVDSSSTTSSGGDGGAKVYRFTEWTEAKEGEHKGSAQRWADLTRALSTNIFYLLTEKRSAGRWHRNKGRTVHTLHKGRARYVVIHADEVEMGLRPRGEARVETFVVGQDVAAGERLQWIVEGAKYKASFLLEDGGEGSGSESKEGCLISETVIPGFEYVDHDFLKPERLVELVGTQRAEELAWLLRREE